MPIGDQPTFAEYSAPRRSACSSWLRSYFRKRMLRPAAPPATYGAAFGNEDARQHGAAHQRDLPRVTLGRVPRVDVADLVAEHAGHLGLGVEVREQPARDVDVAARQRERVDVGLVDDGEVPRQVRPLRRGGQPHPHAGHVLLQRRVVVHAHLGAELLVGLAADADLLALAHERELALAGHRVGGARRRRDGERGEQGRGREPSPTAGADEAGCACGPPV